MIKNIKLLLCTVLICSLFVGCNSSNKNVDSFEDSETNIENDNVREFPDALFIDNEDCKITTSKVAIVNKNAEFKVCIKNKSNNPIEINLDKVNIGNSVKEVNFESKLKPTEIKEDIIIIKDIYELEDLNDKMEGIFLVNSQKYNFIFK